MELRYRDKIQLTRGDHGVLKVEAGNESDMYFGQGYAQAMDRGMQMILTRILAQGRATELLLDNDEMLLIDVFFRRMNWYGDSEKELSKLSAQARKNLEAWCCGINQRFQQKKPWETKLLGIKYESWQPKDCLLFMKLIGYVSLQQSQAEMERLIVQFVQAGVPYAYLDELYPGYLQEMDEDLLRRVTLEEKIVPDSVIWKQWISSFISSNNWVINGTKSSTGKPILSNDPHLESNRLPNVWQEFILKCNDRYAIGAGMPGLPGILVGRNNNASWGATYTFIDAVDSWCEECKDGKYFKDGEWHDFNRREEIIKRKKNGEHRVCFYENNHGVLDGDPNKPGVYLSTCWASSQGTGARSIESIFEVFHVDSVSKLMELTGQIEVSFNWIMADNQGHIGYQMSGLLPKRKKEQSGLVPVDGSKSENDWKGHYAYDQLPRCIDPDCGYIVTANNDLNHLGKTNPINLPMGDYRARRIEELLAEKDNITEEDFLTMHYDLYSPQAKIYMDILRPMLDQSPGGKILGDWDYCYDLDSRGAWLFEQFYIALIKEVFGRVSDNSNHQTPIVHLLDECATFISFYANFDKVLLRENSLWFSGRTREQVFENVYNKAIVPLTERNISFWGTTRKIVLKNIVFDGKLPKFLGFDYGPVALPGGRATPFQGQIYRNAGRDTSFAPSFRLVADMAKGGIKSQLLGGPSDRRFSKWYANEIKMWQQKKYKELLP